MFQRSEERDIVVAKLIQRERGRECDTPRGNASGKERGRERVKIMRRLKVRLRDRIRKPVRS